MHYSNKSYETKWSFLNHKKGNKNLRLKVRFVTLCRLSKKFGLITDKGPLTVVIEVTMYCCLLFLRKQKLVKYSSFHV